MTKLGIREKQMFMEIVETDLRIINRAVKNQLAKLWDEAKKVVEQETGVDKLKTRKEEIRTEVTRLQAELHDLESQIRGPRLTAEQRTEMGTDTDRYGYMRDPNVFGRNIATDMDYKIVQKISEIADPDKTGQFLSTLAKSVMRELAMAGTFEHAQGIYEQFYGLDFRKYGVDIPPRLQEIQDSQELLEQAMEVKQLKGKEDKQ